MAFSMGLQIPENKDKPLHTEREEESSSESVSCLFSVSCLGRSALTSGVVEALHDVAISRAKNLFPPSLEKEKTKTKTTRNKKQKRA